MHSKSGLPEDRDTLERLGFICLMLVMRLRAASFLSLHFIHAGARDVSLAGG